MANNWLQQHETNSKYWTIQHMYTFLFCANKLVSSSDTSILKAILAAESNKIHPIFKLELNTTMVS